MTPGRFAWPILVALTATAHAQPPASPGAAHPMPPETAGEPRRKVVAAVAPTRRSGLDVRDRTTLTVDPVLGNADRIDGNERKGVVAFTFDDGPAPGNTPAVIAALEKYNVPATFFIVTRRLAGKRGEQCRKILDRALASGFLVGSHSVSHANLRHASSDQLTREIDASIRALAVQANRPIGLFRPPYGALGPAGRARLKKLGLTEVLWSVDTLDWKADDPDRLRKKVISMIERDGGGVVLMHDVKSITAKILAAVLDDLEAKNCARLARRREPILPVSLHYFLTDGKTPRALPAAVKRRTDAYRVALPGRCAKRRARMIERRAAAHRQMGPAFPHAALPRPSYPSGAARPGDSPPTSRDPARSVPDQRGHVQLPRASRRM